MPAKMPQRSNSGNRSPRRYTGGAPRTWRKVQLRETDAVLIDGVLGGLEIDEAMRRLAASAAADADALRATLAPHLAIEAWNDEVL